MSENYLLLQQRGKCFLLTSPFIEPGAGVKTTNELRISAIKHDERGWMSENYLFLQQRGKCFLLTSPFIEPGSHYLAFQEAQTVNRCF